MRNRLGVIGSFVWDEIHGRDRGRPPIQEWGGITYSLSGLDAALPDDWEIVPLMKIGSDLADRARHFLSGLHRLAPDAALVEVPYPNNRVELRYFSDERRTEVLTGGVPGWNWLALKPLIDAAKLDALYRSEEHTSELQSHHEIVCRLLLEKTKRRTSAEATVAQP